MNQGSVREGEPDVKLGHSIFSRRSHIDDILIPAESWNMLCNNVDRLLNVCDYWKFNQRDPAPH